MDINLLFEAGEMACGRVLSVLPEDKIKSPKQYMTKVLNIKTMPSINRLYPVLLRRTIYTSQLEPIGDNGNYTGWRIPSRLVDGLKIQGIRQCYPSSSSSSDTNQYTQGRRSYAQIYGRQNRFGRLSSAALYEGVTASQIAYADLQLLGSVTEAPTPRFQAPNIFWINKAYASYGAFNITFCLNNDTNLVTLDDGVFEGVRRLFVLDLKSTIYDEYSTWSNLDTTLGTIDLKIDEWSGCENERNELFDQFDSLSHLRRHATMTSG